MSGEFIRIIVGGSRIGLMAVCALLSGCVVRFTTTESRLASFGAREETMIGSVPTREYLLTRAALLTTSTEPIKISPVSGEGSMNLALGGFGMAVPIDRRGYFLTAAHCVGDGKIQLCYSEASATRAKTGRVVWRGDTGPHPVDLALVCVSSPLDRVYVWAANYSAGDAVLGAGPNYGDLSDPKTARLEYGCFAGELLKVRAYPESEGSYVQISHSAPVHPGDSGGPLVSTKGELIGINCAAWHLNGRAAKLPFLPRGYSYRPDLSWLKRTIDDDFKQHVATELR